MEQAVKKTLKDRIDDVKRIEEEMRINQPSFSIPIEFYIRKPQSIVDEVMAYKTPTPTAVDTVQGVRQVEKNNWIALQADGTQEVFTDKEFVARFDIKPARKS